MHLEQTALFPLLGPKRIERLRAHARIVPCREGEYLYFESAPTEYLFAVRTGEVRTLKSSSAGRVIVLERLLPGELFGMAALIGAPSYTESAQGLADGEVWRLPRRVVGAFLDDPDLTRALLAIVAERLQHAHDRLCSFASDSVTARIAQILTEVSQGEKIETTRRTLGESVGTTVETAIRVLRRFERAGWVEGGVGWVRVLDHAALEHLARGEEPHAG